MITPGSSATPCPKCGASAVTTVDSRHDKGEWRRRRRACRACSHRWSTLEIPENELTALLRQREVLVCIQSMLDMVLHVDGKSTTQAVEHKFYIGAKFTEREQE